MAGIKHAFTSAKADGGDATLVRPLNWNADHVGSGLTDGEFFRATGATTFAAERFVTEYSLLRSNARQIVNLGAGVTEFNANDRAVCDLTNVRQVRLVLFVTIAGVTGDAKAQYSTDDSTWSDLTTNLIDLSATGAKGSTWEDIPVGAKADLIVVRYVALNGNTTEDPTVKAAALQVR